jgi:hypothetical protein
LNRSVAWLVLPAIGREQHAIEALIPERALTACGLV